MERLAMKRLVLLVFLALVGPRLLLAAAAHYVEDHYDIPGVHDCWGIRPHPWECRR